MKKSLFLLVMISGFNQAKAHDFLVDILIYSDDYALSGYEVVVSYELNASQLEGLQKVSRAHYDMKRLVKRSNSGEQEEYSKVGTTDCDFQGDVQNRTCGVFDHFSKGRAAAIDICNAYAVANLMNVNLIPQFIAPDTFISSSASSDEHHDLYDFTQGLSFNCVRVVKKTETLFKN